MCIAVQHLQLIHLLFKTMYIIVKGGFRGVSVVSRNQSSYPKPWNSSKELSVELRFNSHESRSIKLPLNALFPDLELFSRAMWRIYSQNRIALTTSI